MFNINWLSLDWWKYLLAKPAEDTSLWTAFWCRVGNHKAGLTWFNPNGFEPDMTCKNCGDDLG